MSDLQTFRREARAWLEENCPASMRAPTPPDEVVWGGRRETFKNPKSKIWLQRMAGRGWTAPRWPKAYGGAGLSFEEDRVLQEELARIRARPPLNSFGIWMLGPALMEFANEQQRQEHLPPIARGEIRWCQGYSEPGHGSDLAGLQTKAEDRGDHYLVNGAKIWTSYADKADWIFCLVRTDSKAPKREGIGFLLFDMESEGVSTAPIELISGASPFCQTFFDNVRVPKRNLIGRADQGWTIAKRLLQHERKMVASIGGNTAIGAVGRKLQDLAKEYAGERDGRVADPVLRHKIAGHRMNDQAFQLTLARGSEEAKAGQASGHLASLFKYYGTEQNKRKYDLILEIMGTAALGWEGDGFTDKELAATRHWLRSKANTIEGGTSEIQLNVIAKRVLGLPGA